MKRPLAYITAGWGEDIPENAANASKYCRAVYEAGYSPICPVLYQDSFLKKGIAQEYQDGRDMANELLRRSRILVVCGIEVTNDVQEDIALAKHLRIAATTLDGIMTVDGKHSGKNK